MAGALGDHIHRVAVARSVAALRMSSRVGCSFQKSRSPNPRPPVAPPTYPYPGALVPAGTVTQAWSGPVRLRRVKPSALLWSSV